MPWRILHWFPIQCEAQVRAVEAQSEAMLDYAREGLPIPQTRAETAALKNKAQKAKDGLLPAAQPDGMHYACHRRHYQDDRSRCGNCSLCLEYPDREWITEDEMHTALFGGND